ncbi:MAG: ferrous iron transport protein A [Saprospiraceae bacterium]|nr:ferrous iron transport protein A [Saprospiraceae bacterium]
MTTPLTLADVQPGRPVRITHVEEHPSTGRLLAMGLRPGQRVTLVRRTAFGASYYIHAEYQQFGIRRDEAEILWVEYTD